MSDVFYGDGSVLNRIFWDLRVPRLVAAVLAGISLAVSGLSLQTLFRNPLAGPFVLGISSGASLGVALSLLAGFSFGHFGVLTSAAAGAFAVTFLVMLVSNRFRSSTVLLIVGLLVGYFIDALVNLLIVGSDAEALKVFVSWGMGSFCRLTFDGIWIFAVAVTVGCVLIGVSIRYLNAIRMGEDFAKGLGVNVRLYKNLVLFGASLLAASSTAFCGPVAFVGIAVPHLAFMLFKTGNHRLLLPGSALCGAVLCLAAGLFTMVPLNAILSLVGVPVVLLVITRGRGARG
ncbi:MAG: iron ABC transporter permease [Fibrobacter sp.]|nr:iron ABC transporter permease [Fibrobacter sp.]